MLNLKSEMLYKLAVKDKMNAKTLIKDAKNLGPIVSAELEAIDIIYLEQLQKMGWQDSCVKYVEYYPSRLNLNAFCAIIGAINNQDWRKVDSNLKLEAKKLIRNIKLQM